jgi:hypothetical protein
LKITSNMVMGVLEVKWRFATAKKREGYAGLGDEE